jgi:phage gp16-like protein
VRPASRGAPLLKPVADTRAMLAKVHIAKKELGLQEDDYRAVIERVTGRTSSRDCTAQQLDTLLREFKRLGWKGAPPVKARSQRAQVRMIHAIFADIRPHLAVGDDSTLRAFVQRMTKTEANPAGVSAPEFLDGEQAGKVVEGLKAWRTRLRAQAQAVRFGT